MDKPEAGAPRHLLSVLMPAVILIGTIAVFAVASITAGSRSRAAQSTLWKPLLQAYDSIRLGFGADCIGNVYLINGRMLRRATEVQETNIAEAAQTVSDYAAASEIPVLCAAVPTSAGVYAGLLSEDAPSAVEPAALRSFTSQLSGVATVDLLTAFNTLRDDGAYEIYYRTDPRWTSFGAFHAYQVIIRRLGFTAVGYDRYTVTHHNSSYFGTLAQESQYFSVQPDIIDLYTNDAAPELTACTCIAADGSMTAADGCFDRSRSGYDVFRAADVPVLRAETSLQNNRSLLLLCDSFGAPLMPFLLQHYQSVTAVNLALAADTDWRSAVADDTYTQVLILVSAETIAAENGLQALKP